MKYSNNFSSEIKKVRNKIDQEIEGQEVEYTNNPEIMELQKLVKYQQKKYIETAKNVITAQELNMDYDEYMKYKENGYKNESNATAIILLAVGVVIFLIWLL